MKVVIYDKTAGLLTFAWWLGSAISGADRVIGVRSVQELYRKLPPNTTHLQYWGHGLPGAPLVGKERIAAHEIGRRAPGLEEVWWRVCSAHRGKKGKQFAETVCRETGAISIGHTRVIGFPMQGGLCSLFPGESAWWSDHGEELRGCTVFRMSLPHWAYDRQP